MKDDFRENEYLLAALSYLPFISIILLLSPLRKYYYIRYNSAHAFIIYTLSLFLFTIYISLYFIIRNFFKDTFLLDILFGVVLSLHIIINFTICLYFSIKTYNGKYIILPLVTKIYYLIFNK
ncbi:MAG: hypothetical protein KatS3mg068_1307 [Candidatus Sericytochromatia bacterium]|nr:MAG: hypothetical protein KatS3mg068_1307 [Candidatus Sericytochromatia bacterium]